MLPDPNEPHLTVLCFRHAGTHLIMPFLKELSGLPIYDVYKSESPEHSPLGPVAVSFRDPRNIFISQMRWKARRHSKKVLEKGSELADKEIARFIVSRDRNGRSVLRRIGEFVSAWRDHPRALRVDFEMLTGPNRQEEAGMAAAKMGRENQVGPIILEKVLGKGQTYTGSHSNYREWFGPRSWAAWNQTGGPALVDLMGYSNED